METFLDSVIRRFNLLNEMCKGGILKTTDPLYIEFNKLNDDEIKHFPTLIGCYNKKQSDYTPEIIRQHLIKLRYSIAFVDYLTNNSKTNIST